MLKIRCGEIDLGLPITYYGICIPNGFIQFRSTDLEWIKQTAKELSTGVRGSYPADEIKIIEFTAKELER